MLHNFYTLLHIFSKDKSRLYPFGYKFPKRKDPPWDTDLTGSAAGTIGYEPKIFYLVIVVVIAVLNIICGIFLKEQAICSCNIRGFD